MSQAVTIEQKLDILQEWGTGECLTRKRGMEEIVAIEWTSLSVTYIGESSVLPFRPIFSNRNL